MNVFGSDDINASEKKGSLFKLFFIQKYTFWTLRNKLNDPVLNIRD